MKSILPPSKERFHCLDHGNKEEFNRLSQAGKYGNFLKIYPTVAALSESGYKGPLTVRAYQKDSPHFIPVAADFCEALTTMEVRGIPADKVYFQQIPDPTAVRRMNIEAFIGEDRGMELTWERNTTNPVRGIRERGFRCHGLTAIWILNNTLRADSFDGLMELWREDSDLIIEATEFSRPCGEFGRHLVIWEARHKY